MLSLANRSHVSSYPTWLHPEARGVVLDIFVASDASRSRVMGLHARCLKIQIVAASNEQALNRGLVRFLSQALQVAQAQIQIIAGCTLGRRQVRLANLTPQKVLWALAPVRASS